MEASGLLLAALPFCTSNSLSFSPPVLMKFHWLVVGPQRGVLVSVFIFNCSCCLFFVLDVQFLLLFKYTAVLINLLTASIFQGCLWLKHDRTFEILTLFQFY